MQSTRRPVCSTAAGVWSLPVKWMYSVNGALVMPYDGRIACLMETEDFRVIVDRDLWQHLKYISQTGNAVTDTGKKITLDQARLCPGLIDGEDKTKFYIFDLCGNFEFFRMNKGKATANQMALQSAIFYLKAQIVYKLQEPPFTDRGSIVEIFTDLSLWAGIKSVIDQINANAAA